MAGIFNARRASLATLAGLCLMTAVPGRAQDPKVSEARRAALDWLILSDAGDGAASWKAASKRFQSAMTVEKWAEGLQSARGPYGVVEQRTLVSSRASKEFPGLPEGDYAVLVFMTAFANKRGVSETLSIEREADGTWRVVGYSIR